MSKAQNFLDRVMAGQVLPGDIDDAVEAWHHGESAEELHAYLGMTPEEYSLWLESPDMLATICTARQARQALVEVVTDNMSDLRRAAKADNGTKLKKLETWLRQRGEFA